MTETSGRNPFSRLKQKAEQILKQKTKFPDTLDDQDLETILHDLRVHQIELEMQNDELIHAQQQAEFLKEQYFNLFDKAPVGYISVDRSGMIQKVNQHFCEILDFEFSQCRHRPISRFIAETDRDLFNKEFLNARNYSGQTRLQARMKKGENDTIDTELDIKVLNTPLYNGEAEESILIIVRDITELVQAQKEREEKQQLKGLVELSGAICHELRQPLQILLGQVELIAMQLSEDRDLKEDLQRLKDQTRRINHLLGQLTRITKYKTKTYTHNSAIIDLKNSSDRRRHERYTPKKKLFVQFSDDDKQVFPLIDISVGGLSFKAAEPIDLQSNFFTGSVVEPSGKIVVDNLKCRIVFGDENAYTEKDRHQQSKIYHICFADNESMDPRHIDEIIR